MTGHRDPVDIVNQLDAAWSPNFDDYAAGRIHASQVQCVLCTTAPCACPEFGSSEYVALVRRLHGRPGSPDGSTSTSR